MVEENKIENKNIEKKAEVSKRVVVNDLKFEIPDMSKIPGVYESFVNPLCKIKLQPGSIGVEVLDSLGQPIKEPGKNYNKKEWKNSPYVPGTFAIQRTGASGKVGKGYLQISIKDLHDIIKDVQSQPALMQFIEYYSYIEALGDLRSVALGGAPIEVLKPTALSMGIPENVSNFFFEEVQREIDEMNKKTGQAESPEQSLA